jgi:hypothetical protein
MRDAEYLVAVSLLAILASCQGCASRRVPANQDYRVAEIGDTSFLLPPAPEQPANALQIQVSLGELGDVPPPRHAGDCTIRGRWFSLYPQGSGKSGNWQALLPLPAAWYDGWLPGQVRSEWDHFLDKVSDIESAGCMSPGAYGATSNLLAESMPSPVTDSLFFRYSLGADGYIKLKPGMRLFVERSIFRNPEEEETVSNYLGERKIYYEIEGAEGKRLTLTRRGMWSSKGLPADAAGAVADAGLSRQFSGMGALRLFMLTLFVPPNVHRNSVLIGVRNPREMVRVTQAVKKNPEVPCRDLESQGVVCASFEGVVSASVEVNAIVDGHLQYFPIGSTVETALDSVPGESRSTVLSTLRIRRLFGGTYRDVKFSANDSEILKLSLSAGDRISWKQ